MKNAAAEPVVEAAARRRKAAGAVDTEAPEHWLLKVRFALHLKLAASRRCATGAMDAEAACRASLEIAMHAAEIPDPPFAIGGGQTNISERLTLEGGTVFFIPEHEMRVV